MINEFLNLCRIGKTLGLKPWEISKVLSNKPRNFKSEIFVSLIVVAIVTFVIVLLVIIGTGFINPGINPQDNTYTPGTLYSTVKVKDFKKKR
ncbi:MAG: hypothetical protein EAX89_15300 [Candidatus Lokiarchaeota archaeon]|nr:hypothetical protein [Candidatus Lokiarchaeota archaeon]